MSHFTNEWSSGLCNCGCGSDCCYGCCCPTCAIAQAKTNLDGSSCLVNFCLLSSFNNRYLIRTAYGIKGSCIGDCLLTTCFPSCVACQLMNQVKSAGNPAPDSGASANVNPWPVAKDPFSTPSPFTLCVKSTCCLCCVQADVMNETMGMGWFNSCCCFNTFGSHNVYRYHNRIQGDDFMDEFALPLVAKMFGLDCCYAIYFVMRLRVNTSGSPRSEEGQYLSNPNASVGVVPATAIKY